MFHARNQTFSEKGEGLEGCFVCRESGGGGGGGGPVIFSVISL